MALIHEVVHQYACCTLSTNAGHLLSPLRVSLQSWVLYLSSALDTSVPPRSRTAHPLFTVGHRAGYGAGKTAIAV